ncbi:MAG: hypothetical protein WC901_07930, partial [Candidatus Margulisiibacteriota bacterium]
INKIFGNQPPAVTQTATQAAQPIPQPAQPTPQPAPPATQTSTQPTTQPVIINNYNQNTNQNTYQPAPTYFGPIPVYNPVYYADMQKPTYYEDREYAPNPKQTPAGKAQFGLGLTWMHDKNATLDQNTNWYTLSLATAWEETVSLGTNVNVYDLTIPSTNVRGFGAGLDLGMLIRSYERLFIGLCAQEILTTDIHWTNGATTTYRMNVNAGVALRPIKEFTLAADIHNFFMQNGEHATYHYGVEIIPTPGLALRAGSSDYSETLGAGIKIGEILADYAILNGNYNHTQMASLAWKF